MTIKIAPRVTAQIPSGRIEVIDASDPSAIRLRVPSDPGTPYISWYNFRLSGLRGVPTTVIFEDTASGLVARHGNRAGYEDQWTNTGPLISEDGATWRRVPASYDGETFRFSFTPTRDVVQIAKFAPFGPERDEALLYRALSNPGVRHRQIGQSVQGRPIDMVTFGAGRGKPVLWIVTRLHPSETQGGFLLEGLWDRLLDPADGAARVLLERAELNVVINGNPDGSALGLSRSNAAGVNLNRMWEDPDPEKAPEVVAIREAMLSRGVDFSLDAHADQELRCNFIWPSENVPGWNADRAHQFTVFEDAWALASPDYEKGHPYPGGCPKEPRLSMGWNWIGATFPKSLSVLLEQPFKDISSHPVAETGWCPARARDFGRSLVTPMLAVLPHLAVEGADRTAACRAAG